jgi:hypothetical protein
VLLTPAGALAWASGRGGQAGLAQSKNINKKIINNKIIKFVYVKKYKYEFIIFLFIDARVRIKIPIQIYFIVFYLVI